MVGGTVADMFAPANRGFAMSIFTLATFTGQVGYRSLHFADGQSLGGVAFGWIGQNLGIQWAYGVREVSEGIRLLIIVDPRHCGSRSLYLQRLGIARNT